MPLYISGGNIEKRKKLNPYKRITRGTTVNVGVNGTDVEAIVDNAGKYTYLAVDGTDYYVSAVLEDGAGYEVVEEAAKPKKDKAAE